MKLTFLIAFTFFSSNLFSQVADVYIADIDKSFYCTLELDKNSRFVLEFVEKPLPGSDISGSTLLSFGTYTTENNVIHCKDINGTIMTSLQKNKNQLKMLDGFKFLNNRTFILSVVPQPNLDMFFDDKELDRKINTQYENSKNKHLSIGKYFTNDGFSIELKYDNTYDYFYHSFVLSSGTWSKNKSIITFQDSFFLKSLDIIIVDNNTIKCQFLPIDYDGIVFKLKKSK